MNRLAVSAALAALAFGVSAQAAPIFSDDFNANPLGLNIAPAGWTVASGTVDLIGNGFFDFLPGNGVYVDLDGSTSKAGLLTSPTLNLTGGMTYTATFDLAGSHRGSTETGTVTFGSATLSYSVASGDGFAATSLSFTPTTSGAYTLSFQNAGGDNVGALLDNVAVNPAVTGLVPEPQTYALMLAGLAAVGMLSRRRRHGAESASAEIFSRQ